MPPLAERELDLGLCPHLGAWALEAEAHIVGEMEARGNQ